MILAFLDELSSLWAPLAGLGSLAARAGLAALLAFLTALALGPPLLRALRARAYIEDQVHTDSEELNERNTRKQATPTMGGVLIVAAIVVSGVVFGDLGNRYVGLAVLATLGYGFIGFVDDWVKLTRPGRRGLRALSKYGLQALVAVSLAFVITQLLQRQGRPELLSLSIPWCGERLDLSGFGGLPHMLLVVLVVTGTSNAVNLTDGMDGLASGSMVASALAMGAIAVAVGRAEGLELQLAYVPRSQEMAVFCAAMAGATLGFLWFNAPPAMVYMGDTGSLPLGGLLGYVAVVLKQELVLVLVAGVFVWEALSVILQVGSYKLRGKKRVFLCAPYHHHLQFKNVPDTRIVVRFWIVAVLCAAAGLASLAVL